MLLCDEIVICLMASSLYFCERLSILIVLHCYHYSYYVLDVLLPFVSFPVFDISTFCALLSFKRKVKNSSNA